MDVRSFSIKIGGKKLKENRYKPEAKREIKQT